MNRTARIVLAGSLLTAAVASPLSAETIELVTYYPAPGSGDLNVTSLTVGPDYALVTPGPGQAFFQGPVGIGAGFTAGAGAPSEALEVIGNIQATGPAGGNALFIADRPNTAALNGLVLGTNGAQKWTIGSSDATESL